MWHVVFVCNFCLTLLLLFMVREARGFFETLMVLIVAISPMTLQIGLTLWFNARRKAAYAAMLAQAGVAKGGGFDHSEGGTGIAINRAAKTLTVMARGERKTYRFDEVREWETRKERGGVVVGAGLQGGLAALGSNLAADREAAANSGLFLLVKDIDHPRWRIEMKSSAAQARWMEILRQQINED